MAGPIQKALSQVVNIGAGAAVATKKLNEDERQNRQKELNEEEAKAKANTAIQEEAKGAALEADLIRMGADPESAKAFVNAKELGLDTKSFGMIRKKGKFIGTYSSLAEKLSKDSLTDSLSSKVINDKGFAERVIALGGTRRGRVDALVKATQGGKK